MRAGGARSAAGLAALAAMAAALLLAWLGSPSGVPAAGPGSGLLAVADEGQVVEAGRGLYVANCATCHGSDLQGGEYGPSLEGVGEASVDFYLRTGRMPLAAPLSIAKPHEPVLTEEQIEAIVAYVGGQIDGPGIPQVVAGGEVSAGWRLFQANCAACHNATGTGNAIGGGFVAGNLGGADPRIVAEATIVGPGAMPAFQFSDEQLADLAAYVAFLRDAPTPGGAAIGRTGPVAEGFVAVAVGLPMLILLSLFVARHGRGERPRETLAGPSGQAEPGAETDPTRDHPRDRQA